MTCNVCGSEVAAEQGSSLWKDDFELVRCGSCGLLFRRTLPRPNELATLYAADYFSDRHGVTGGYADYVRDARLHRSLAARRLAKLERLTSGRTLLDVGAAAGFFVSEAIERGWAASGIDISPAMVDYAAESLGVPVSLGNLSTVERGRFDVVTMWDYIEHSLDPAGDIARVTELLEPEGMLALSTGDAESVVARVSGRHWHLLTPRHHNFFFGKTTAVRLLEQHGLKVVHISHPGARYSLSHVVHKLGGTTPGRLTSALARLVDGSRLGRLPLPINLFDIVTVFARKTVG